MDHNGIPYFQFLRNKRKFGTAHGPLQPQEGSYFCLYNDHFQILGLDTAYFENGRFRDAGQLAWLTERLREGRAAGKVNILLSQNEPYHGRSYRELFHTDLHSLVGPAPTGRLVDLWFWGDEHGCALYPAGPCTPFVGSCIGHGGYPFMRRDLRDFENAVVPPHFVEKEPRHDVAWGMRDEVGNNGFCVLDLAPDRVSVRYVDWRRRPRHEHAWNVVGGVLA
jgi:hypothetical protein